MNFLFSRFYFCKYFSVNVNNTLTGQFGCRKHTKAHNMSSLRDKYEQSKRGAYIPRERLAERFSPREKKLLHSYESHRASTYANDFRFGSATRDKQDFSYKPPLKDVAYSREYSSSNYKPKYDGNLGGTAEGDDFSPIRTIPFALGSKYSPSSLYKTQPKKSGDGILKSRATNSGYRVSKLDSQKGGILKRLGLYFFNRIVKEDNKLDSSSSGRKRVLFASENLPFTKNQENSTPIDTSVYEDALNEERERNKRLTLSYEQEVRRLEDELDFKDQEFNSLKEMLELRERKEQENLEKLEESFNKSLRENEVRHLEDRLRLLELKELLNAERTLIQRESVKIQDEKEKLMKEKRDIENKLRKYELDLKRLVEQQVNTLIRPLAKEHASTRDILLKEEVDIQKEIDDNKDQHVRFFETLLKISDSLPRYNERFFLSLDSIVSDQRTVPKPTRRLEKLKVLEKKVNEYLSTFDQITASTKTLQLSSLFEKLEKNLSISLEKRKRNVKQLDHEIFKANLILADGDTILQILSLTLKSASYLRYLRLFEHKGTLLEEMKLLIELLLRLNTLTVKLYERDELVNINDNNFNNLITSTPRNNYENSGERLSPIDYSTFFRELDRLIQQF